MEFEKLEDKKFKKMSKMELASIRGGLHVIYDDVVMATVSGQTEQATGVYGYRSFLGIRTSENGFFQSDTQPEN